MTGTAYFTPELFRFLRALKRHNNRAWFETNKPRYLEHVRDPLLEFIADFGKPLKKISPHFVADPRPQGGSMFRIYRDVRFAKDKRPYKTAATAQFRHRRGKDVHAPGFYLHLGADEIYVGAGLWHPDADNLKHIRGAIVEHPQRWKRATNGKAFLASLTLGGESLKRPPRGFDSDHPLVEDLKRKDFVCFSSLTQQQACAPGFMNEVAETYRAARPFMRFLTNAVGVEF